MAMEFYSVILNKQTGCDKTNPSPDSSGAGGVAQQ